MGLSQLRGLLAGGAAPAATLLAARPHAAQDVEASRVAPEVGSDPDEDEVLLRLQQAPAPPFSPWSE